MKEEEQQDQKNKNKITNTRQKKKSESEKEIHTDRCIKRLIQMLDDPDEEKNMQKEKTNRIFEGESKDKNFEGKYGIHSPKRWDIPKQKRKEFCQFFNPRKTHSN